MTAQRRPRTHYGTSAHASRAKFGAAFGATESATLRKVTPLRPTSEYRLAAVAVLLIAVALGLDPLLPVHALQMLDMQPQFGLHPEETVGAS